MDSQFPLDCPKRHPLAPGFLNHLPSLLLKERRFARRGGCGIAGGRRGRPWPRCWPPRLGCCPWRSRRGPVAPPAGRDSCPRALSPRPWHSRTASSSPHPWLEYLKYDFLPEVVATGVCQPPLQLRGVGIYSHGCKQGCFQPWRRSGSDPGRRCASAIMRQGRWSSSIRAAKYTGGGSVYCKGLPRPTHRSATVVLGYPRRVPGSDVAIGVSAYQLASSTQDAVAAASRGRLIRSRCRPEDRRCG